MRKSIWALVYLFGIIPAVLVTVPASLLMVVIFDGWGGYYAKPDHLPLVWWRNWTGRNAALAAAGEGKP